MCTWWFAKMQFECRCLRRNVLKIGYDICYLLYLLANNIYWKAVRSKNIFFLVCMHHDVAFVASCRVYAPRGIVRVWTYQRSDHRARAQSLPAGVKDAGDMLMRVVIVVS